MSLVAPVVVEEESGGCFEETGVLHRAPGGLLFAAAVSLARTGGSLAFAGGLLRASPGSFVLAGGLLSKTAREESFHVPERELPGVFFEEAGG